MLLLFISARKFSIWVFINISFSTIWPIMSFIKESSTDFATRCICFWCREINYIFTPSNARMWIWFMLVGIFTSCLRNLFLESAKCTEDCLSWTSLLFAITSFSLLSIVAWIKLILLGGLALRVTRKSIGRSELLAKAAMGVASEYVFPKIIWSSLTMSFIAAMLWEILSISFFASNSCICRLASDLRWEITGHVWKYQSWHKRL